MSSIDYQILKAQQEYGCRKDEYLFKATLKQNSAYKNGFENAMYLQIQKQAFFSLFDFFLVILCIYLTFNGPDFLGGFGWFLLLGLSPKAWKSHG